MLYHRNTPVIVFFDQIPFWSCGLGLVGVTIKSKFGAKWDVMALTDISITLCFLGTHLFSQGFYAKGVRIFSILAPYILLVNKCMLITVILNMAKITTQTGVFVNFQMNF